MLIPKKLLQVAVSLFLSVLVAPSSGLAATENFSIDLIATIDDGPAMRNVEWRVMRRHSGEEIRRVRRHTAHVNVPPGNYKVVARMTSSNRTVTRSRYVKVRNDTKVIVPMDH